jgi:hypothetical protein
MSFLKGSMSFFRCQFGACANVDPLEVLEAHKFGTQKIARPDGAEYGFVAGEMFDLAFEHGKTLVDGALFFGVRIDSIALPGALIRAYYQQEITAMAAGNPSGFASAKQKKEARETAKEFVLQEARDGKHRRQKVVPVFGDLQKGYFLVGASGASGDLALAALAEAFKLGVLSPSGFPPTVSHVSMPLFGAECHHVANEFLMWLWWHAGHPLRKECEWMVDRVIETRCPNGVNGRDVFRGDAPGTLPEARQAIRAGRMPCKIGIAATSADDIFSFVLDESMAVSGARVPKVESKGGDWIIERASNVRRLINLIDTLTEEFVKVRCDVEWEKARRVIDEWRRMDLIACGG